MFEKFQQLTPVQRSLIVLIPLALLIVVLAVLFNVSQRDEAPVPGDSPSPSETYVAPDDGTSDAPTPSVSPYALNTPPPGTQDGQNTSENSRKYTEKQKQAAKEAAYKTMVDFCRYTPKESREDRLARIRSYYVPGKFNLGIADMSQLIKTQQCSVFAYELTGDLEDDGAIGVGGAMQQTTIYQDGTPIIKSKSDDGKDLAYSKNVGIKLYMQLVKGKWLAENITVSGD